MIWLGIGLYCLGIISGIFLTLMFFIGKGKRVKAAMNRHERRKAEKTK